MRLAHLGTRNNGQPGFRQPAQDNWPVPRQAVLVHGVKAENCVAVMAAHHPRASGRAKEGAPDRVYAWSADVKALLVLHFGFLRPFVSAMMSAGNVGSPYCQEHFRMSGDGSDIPAAKRPLTPLESIRKK